MKTKCKLRDFKYIIYFKDKKNRYILIRPYNYPQDRDGLVKMYEKFDPEDRCLGLPPVKKEALKSWLDYIDEKGISILAEHHGEGDRAPFCGTLWN